MTTIESKWYGPFSAIPVDGQQWLVEDRQSLRPGVYLWTARVGNEYRVNYIGMSANSIAARTMEHLSKAFGVNVVENPDDFRRGVRNEYLFYPGEDDWLVVRDQILPRLIEYLKLNRIFFAPINVDSFLKYGVTELKRIESALITQVWDYESRNDLTEFLINRRRSRAVKSTDTKLPVIIRQSSIHGKIRGIDESFDA